MKTFYIYFNDLNEDAKKRLLKEVKSNSPEDMNWDVDIFPIAQFDFEDDVDKCYECLGIKNVDALNNSICRLTEKFPEDFEDVNDGKKYLEKVDEKFNSLRGRQS